MKQEDLDDEEETYENKRRRRRLEGMYPMRRDLRIEYDEYGSIVKQTIVHVDEEAELEERRLHEVDKLAKQRRRRLFAEGTGTALGADPEHVVGDTASSINLDESEAG